MNKIIAASYAPMVKNGELNPDIIGKYGEFLKKNGIYGTFVNGSTGDFVSLSLAERKLLIEAWAASRPEGFKLINHVGHTNLREARELARHSNGKVDAIAALPPFYFRLKTPAALLEYCAQIASAAPDIPFYYYHIPLLSGANFLMIDFLEIMADAIPNFAGIKYTHHNLEDFSKCLEHKKKYEILYGVDEELVSSLSFQAKGWVGSTYNHLAPLYLKIIECFNNGFHTQAEELQKMAVTFVETLDGYDGFNGAGKSFMRVFDLDMGPSRFPHKTLTDKELNLILEDFEKNGLAAFLSSPSLKTINTP